MNVVCLDMEGVLVPEIWIAFAEASGIPELKRTTRDEPDYDKLMQWRIGILKEHGLGLRQIQDTIAKIDPLPGAKQFLDELRAQTQVIILSDTFEEFAKPLMEKLGWIRKMGFSSFIILTIVLMAVIAVGVSVAVYAFLATTIWMPRLVYLGLSVCAAMAMYLVLLKVCKIEELNFLKALVKR